jgi:hypothetical protein
LPFFPYFRNALRFLIAPSFIVYINSVYKHLTFLRDLDHVSIEPPYRRDTGY